MGLDNNEGLFLLAKILLGKHLKKNLKIQLQAE